jgi:hypothetical protein
MRSLLVMRAGRSGIMNFYWVLPPEKLRHGYNTYLLVAIMANFAPAFSLGLDQDPEN